MIISYKDISHWIQVVIFYFYRADVKHFALCYTALNTFSYNKMDLRSGNGSGLNSK